MDHMTGRASVFTPEAQARLFAHFTSTEIRLLELFVRGLMDERERGAAPASGAPVCAESAR
ncbi:MAG: hypothetical protein CMJ42_03875 [Phyllobacteriaceae bacterium]|nr:hypothetical protein [Phyllobacteriaceae bacterium]MBA92888.1 hypothetical protein [Phyllobacteriaceae bacterium]